MYNGKMSQTEVKALGFTDKLILELLPEPELRDNPYYRSAHPMKLYEETDVQKAMETDRFKEEQTRLAKRREAAQKGVATKTAKLQKQFELLLNSVNVKKISMDKLRKATLKEKQDWYDYQCELRGYDYPNFASDANEETVQRWMVNYLRHSATSYDRDILKLYGRTGKAEVYSEFYIGLMRKIEATYPELADECERQIERKYSLNDLTKMFS